MTLVPPYPGSGWSGAEGPGRKIWGGSVGAGASGVLVAFINSGGNTAAEPGDGSTHPWTSAGFTANFANPGQFPGPGGPSACGMWYRNVVPGEGVGVITLIHPSGTDAVGCWVYQLSGVTLAGIAESHATDTLTWAPAVLSEHVSPAAAVASVWLAGWALQKVNYGQATTTQAAYEGTTLADVNGANVVLACGDGDASPPKTYIGYAEGSGVLKVGAHLDCCGSGPGCYNFYGRGLAGLLMPKVVGLPFNIVQSAYGGAFGADFTVNLPVPP